MRSIRRHHRERLKAKRRWHWGRDPRYEPEALAKAVDTPKPHCRYPCCQIERQVKKHERRKLRRQPIPSEEFIRDFELLATEGSIEIPKTINSAEEFADWIYSRRHP